jgi:small neutral amino acid transporter SnatA (MarC family)
MPLIETVTGPDLRTPDEVEEAIDLIPQAAGALLGLTIAAAIIYLTYRYSGSLLIRLGRTGTMVLTWPFGTTPDDLAADMRHVLDR